MKATNKQYDASNAIINVDKQRFSHKEYNNLLACGEGVTERQNASQRLIDYLCAKYNISSCKVSVKNTPQPSWNRGKTLGKYHTSFHIIEVWNLTAKQHKVVSIKGFTETLLHEFMHHYDLQYLRLGTSIHSAGFYKRISDLNNKLKP